MTRARVGTFVSLASPEATAIVSAHLDFVVVDAEHGIGDESVLVAQLRAARSLSRWVRVRRMSDAPKALDLGADGVVVPRIRAAAEVAELVRLCAYPPDGVRGIGPSAANLYGMLLREQVTSSARRGEVWPQIETLEAVDALPEILALDPRPTGVFIGPGDLSAALGRPGELGHPDVREVVERIVEECLEAAWEFAIFSPDREDAEHWIEMGASAVVIGSDASWMIEGAAPAWALAEAAALA